VDEKRALDGLLSGLADDRFEVRNACALAMVEFRRRNHSLEAYQKEILAAVSRELQMDSQEWKGQKPIDREPREGSTPVENQPSESDTEIQNLEYIFTLLGLILDDNSLQNSLRALRSGDIYCAAPVWNTSKTSFPNRFAKSSGPLDVYEDQDGFRFQLTTISRMPIQSRKRGVFALFIWLISATSVHSQERPKQPTRSMADADSDAPIQRDDEGDLIERTVPDYTGRGVEPKTAGDVLIWVPRVILSPLYVVSEYIIRQPLGALTTAAEKGNWPTIVVSVFTLPKNIRWVSFRRFTRNSV